MPQIEITFFDGETGKPASVPTDFEPKFFYADTNKEVSPTNVTVKNDTAVVEIEDGIYNLLFYTEEKILSLFQKQPCNLALLTLDGISPVPTFAAYLWDLAPESPSDGNCSRSDDDYDGPPRFTCVYCYDRYTTPSSPYYMNLTWYNNCMKTCT